MTESSLRERVSRHPLTSLLTTHTGGPVWHAVGGFLRDALLGLDSADLDITVPDQGAQLANHLAEASGGSCVALGGDRFASYRVVAGRFQVDIWDRRGGSLSADLERRDLTVNSIAYGLETNELIDFVEGVSDLRGRKLRATKLDCFERDPLRVLRLARFRVTLSAFTVDAATAAAARRSAPWLEQTAVERIRDELQLMLSAHSTHTMFATLAELGALDVLVPETANPAASATLLESSDRLDRCVHHLEQELPELAWGDDDRTVAAVSLLLSVAGGTKSVTGAARLERRGIAKRKSLRAAARALEGELPRDEDSRRLFILTHGPDWSLAFAVKTAIEPIADLSAAFPIALDLARTARANPTLVRGAIPLLDGRAAARILGVGPGPAVGETLRALARAQALGLVNSRRQAEDFVRNRSASAASGKGDLRPTSRQSSDAD